MTTVTDLREVEIGTVGDSKGLIDLNEIAAVIKQDDKTCTVILKGGGVIPSIEEDYDKLVGWWRNTIATNVGRK